MIIFGRAQKNWRFLAGALAAGFLLVILIYFNKPFMSLEAEAPRQPLPPVTEKAKSEAEQLLALSLEEVNLSEQPAVETASSSPQQVISKPQPLREPAASLAIKTGQIDQPVPFSSQAPLFNWEDSRQQDGCEEAAALMAMLWVKDEGGWSKAEWEERITGLADFEQEKYQEHRDVAAQDVVSRIFNDYFSYHKVRVKSIGAASDILEELERGNLVLAPANGQALDNPHFKPPGPAHHFLVIKGYDYDRAEFITNDPGTRLGAGYRYPAEKLIAALRAYPTGYHGRYETERKTAIVVEK